MQGNNLLGSRIQGSEMVGGESIKHLTASPPQIPLPKLLWFRSKANHGNAEKRRKCEFAWKGGNVWGILGHFTVLKSLANFLSAFGLSLKDLDSIYQTGGWDPLGGS